MNFVIILAAGKSKRMKGMDKLFFKIKGKPLVFYAIQAFEKHPQIRKIILVTKEENFKRFSSLIRNYKLKKVLKLAKGGQKRQDSVLSGLKTAEELKAKAGDLILIHNGANPLVSQKEIGQVIRATKKYKVAAVAIPARDTIKKVNKNGFVIQTLDRKQIFLAQTPQAVEYKLAKRAFDKAFRDRFYGTDDLSLVERLGKKPKIVLADSKNIKVTYPEDLKFIKSQLE